MFNVCRFSYKVSMMVYPLLSLFLALTVISVATISSQDRRFLEIVPARGNSISNCSVQTCIGFTQLLQYPSMFFTSNTTIVFQQGLYKINRTDPDIGNILIRQVENLAIFGPQTEFTAKIVCTGNFGLTFVNVRNLTLRNIHITGCGSSYTSEIKKSVDPFVKLCNGKLHLHFPPCNDHFYISSSTITIVHAVTVSMDSIYIQQSKETGVLAVNVHNELTLRNVRLVNNSINCVITTVHPFHRLVPVDTYRIQNCYFALGNVTNTQRLLASGLNVLLRQLLQHQVHLMISYTEAHDNVAIYGNVLIQVDNCGDYSTQVVEVFQLKLCHKEN